MRMPLLVGMLAAIVVTAGTVTPQAKARMVSPPCPFAAPPPAYGPKPKPEGVLTIGAIGLRTPIFKGSEPDIDTEASRSLMWGPAFYPRSMNWLGRLNHWPGQGGTVGMLGHRTTRLHPFCLVANLRVGHAYAVIQMSYGTFVYKLVGMVIVAADNWSAFAHPRRFDPHPKHWVKGIKPEYLVTGACTPPHSATSRINDIYKLVAKRPPK